MQPLPAWTLTSVSLSLAPTTLPATSSSQPLADVAPFLSLPFLLLPPPDPSSCGQGNWSRLQGELVEESRWSCHCRAPTASSLPILAAAASFVKMSSSSDGTFSIPFLEILFMNLDCSSSSVGIPLCSACLPFSDVYVYWCCWVLACGLAAALVQIWFWTCVYIWYISPDI